MSYEPEKIEPTHNGDRRIRDKHFCPKRRGSDPKRPLRPFNQREEEVWTLIEGHIERLLAKREVKEAPEAPAENPFGNPFWESS